MMSVVSKRALNAMRTRGVHFIVKLNTMCDKPKSIFYIKDHQNRSIFFIFFS